jgi:hypothetical protein
MLLTTAEALIASAERFAIAAESGEIPDPST